MGELQSGFASSSSSDDFGFASSSSSDDSGFALLWIGCVAIATISVALYFFCHRPRPEIP
jgi:hypothetical protein